MKTIDKKRKKKQVLVDFDSVGWKSLLQQKGGTSKILILKSVVRGLCLERGMPIYSYVGEDQEGRPLMVSYLDGKPRIVSENHPGDEKDDR
jgi:hypothetical protein